MSEEEELVEEEMEEPRLAPVGFNWQISVALSPGMAAREVAVAALGTVYAIEGGKEAAEQIGQTLAGKWSLATALALLAWYRPAIGVRKSAYPGAGRMWNS